MNYHIQSLFRFNIPFAFHWPFSKTASVTLSFCQFFDANYGGQEYDALEMRGGEEVGSATKPPSRVCPTSYSIGVQLTSDIDRWRKNKQLC